MTSPQSVHQNRNPEISILGRWERDSSSQNPLGVYPSGLSGTIQRLSPCEASDHSGSRWYDRHLEWLGVVLCDEVEGRGTVGPRDEVAQAVFHKLESSLFDDGEATEFFKSMRRLASVPDNQRQNLATLSGPQYEDLPHSPYLFMNSAQRSPINNLRLFHTPPQHLIHPRQTPSALSTDPAQDFSIVFPHPTPNSPTPLPRQGNISNKRNRSAAFTSSSPSESPRQPSYHPPSSQLERAEEVPPSSQLERAEEVPPSPQFRRAGAVPSSAPEQLFVDDDRGVPVATSLPSGGGNTTTPVKISSQNTNSVASDISQHKNSSSTESWDPNAPSNQASSSPLPKEPGSPAEDKDEQEVHHITEKFLNVLHDVISENSTDVVKWVINLAFTIQWDANTLTTKPDFILRCERTRRTLLIENKRKLHHKTPVELLGQEVAHLLGQARHDLNLHSPRSSKSRPPQSISLPVHLLCWHHLECFFLTSSVSSEYLETLAHDSSRLPDIGLLLVERSRSYNLKSEEDRVIVAKRCVMILGDLAPKTA
jgi:hypothetical protein